MNQKTTRVIRFYAITFTSLGLIPLFKALFWFLSMYFVDDFDVFGVHSFICYISYIIPAVFFFLLATLTFLRKFLPIILFLLFVASVSPLLTLWVDWLYGSLVWKFSLLFIILAFFYLIRPAVRKSFSPVDWFSIKKMIITEAFILLGVVFLIVIFFLIGMLLTPPAKPTENDLFGYSFIFLSLLYPLSIITRLVISVLKIQRRSPQLQGTSFQLERRL